MTQPMTPAAANEAAIRLRDVRVRVDGRTLLDIPRLEIASGERVAVVGPNGAGKSTLLRMLAGFAPIACGEVSILGRTFGAGADNLTPTQWRALRVELGHLMQGLNLVPRLSARDNVLIGASSRMQLLPFWRNWARIYPEHLRAEADAALAALELLDRAHVRADRLSGGERQKVALARLKVQRPVLVLADEPTAALDPSATRIACEALLTAPASRTLVCVVHQPDLLPHLADRVLGIAQGRIAWDLPTPAIEPATLRSLYDTSDPALPTGRMSTVVLGEPINAL